RPLNSIQLERASQVVNDQPGCVHANMDLFKWALKLWPLLPSEELADAFELAVECRLLDMRASPYDLSSYRPGALESSAEAMSKVGRRAGRREPGEQEVTLRAFDLSPVKVETEEGRKTYQREQLRLYQRSLPLRRKLLSRMDHLLEAW
ncbi:unnamed protein product, partial [Choristocarpus tenellus]